MTVSALLHSLRTPLNHIIGFGEILREELGADHPSAESLGQTLDRARDVLGEVQKLPAPDAGAEADETVLQRIRKALEPSVRALWQPVETLSLTISGEPEDLIRLRSAADRLTAFVENRTGSLGNLEAGDSADAPAAAAVPAPHEKFPACRGRLLVADDNVANRDILTRNLERQNYRVFTASNGQECLERLAEGYFDLVLLDVVMPVMDGFEVLSRIRQNPATREIPVVMISALDETASVVHCIQMGAEDYLMKPFDPVLLSARIDASLEKKRLRDEDRKRTAELETTLDELRRTQAQLLVQDKLASLGAMTAGIAHEIRNPLNFITNFAGASVDIVKDMREQIAKAGSADNLSELLDQLEQYVTKVDEHGRRADRIIRGMLMHSRGKSGNPESVDVNVLLRDSVNLAYHGLRAQDRSFNVTLDVELADGLPNVIAVPQELSRVFLNVVNNACHAAWERKRQGDDGFEPAVKVSSKAERSWIEIRIHDNGFGIPADVMPKIFRPFFTTKPAGAGTGLGLSISYEIIVHRHGGSFVARSEPGNGAEFIIGLPGVTQGANHAIKHGDAR